MLTLRPDEELLEVIAGVVLLHLAEAVEHLAAGQARLQAENGAVQVAVPDE